MSKYVQKLYYTGAEPTDEYTIRKICEWGGKSYQRKSKGHQAALVAWRILCYVLTAIIFIEAMVCLGSGDVRTAIGATAASVAPLGLCDACPGWFIEATKYAGGERK